MLYKKGFWGVLVVVLACVAVLIVVLAGPNRMSITGILGIKELVGMSPEAIMKDADEAFNNKYYEEAIRLYNEALQLYANEGESKFRKNNEAIRAQYKIGEAYFALQDCENAIRAYNKIDENFELNPVRDKDIINSIASKKNQCTNISLGLPY